MNQKLIRNTLIVFFGIELSNDLYKQIDTGFFVMNLDSILSITGFLICFIWSVFKDTNEYSQTKKIKSFIATFFGLFVILGILGFYYYLKSQKS